MNCDCMNQIDEKLSERNLALDRMFLLGEGRSTLYVTTHFKDTDKKKRGDKTTNLVVTFCPFCGAEVESKDPEVRR